MCDLRTGFVALTWIPVICLHQKIRKKRLFSHRLHIAQHFVTVLLFLLNIVLSMFLLFFLAICSVMCELLATLASNHIINHLYNL